MNSSLMAGGPDREEPTITLRAAFQPFERLRGARAGIIGRIARQTLPAHLPQALRCYAATVADTRRFSPWPCDRSATGCVWWDDDAAQLAALGEAVERYCGNLIRRGLRRASYAELAAAGVAALDPAALALFSAEQYARPGCPFVPFARELPVRWIAGRDLAADAPTLVPASLVYTSYFLAPPLRDEPLTNPLMVSGIAAGQTAAAAECAALEECLERDTVTLAWLRGERPTRVLPPASWEPLLRGPLGRLEAILYLFPGEFGVPTLAALLHDRANGALTLGTACRPDPTTAALKALAEALQLQVVAAGLATHDSPFYHARTDRSALKPWRADRRYATDYRSDWRDVTELLCQLQLAFDPAVQRRIRERLAGGPAIALAAIGPGGPRTRANYLARLRARGFRPLAVDVTTADVRDTGLHVARVVVPGLYSYAPAAFTMLGGKRLARASLTDELGRPESAIPPLPFA